MIETFPVLRIACEQPAPPAFADFEPFTRLGRGHYGIAELGCAPATLYAEVLQRTRRLFGRWPSLGICQIQPVRAVFFDMDATVIKQESLVELAAWAGKGAEVEAITEQAMRGELDYRQSLVQRVALLAGLPAEETFAKVLTKLELQPGIIEFINFCRALGVPCYMISGGFTAVAGPIAQRLGFRQYHSNTLGIVADKLTGQVEGAIVDAAAKRDFLLKTCADLGIDPKQTAAVGDGANDRLMLEAAGVAIGFEPKPVLLPHLAAVTNHHHFLGPLLFGRDVMTARQHNN